MRREQDDEREPPEQELIGEVDDYLDELLYHDYTDVTARFRIDEKDGNYY